MFSKSRLLIAGVCLAVAALFAVNGCVTSSGGGGGAGILGGGGGSNPVVARIDGRDIKASEMLSSPIFRQSLRQWAAVEHLKREAAEANIVVNKDEIDKKLLEQKTQMAQFGQKWEDVLKSQGMTEDEVRSMMEFSELSKKLAEKKAGALTEADIKEEWQTNEQMWRERYGQEKMLSDADKKALTFEAAKDFVKEKLTEQKAMEVQQGMFTDALKAVKVQFPPLGSEEGKYLDLIIKSALPDEEPAEEEPSADAPAAAGDATGQAEEGKEPAAPPADEHGAENHGADGKTPEGGH